MTLRELRKTAKLTLDAVATQIEVNGSTIRNWEKGRTIPHFNVYQVSKLCSLYSCSIQDLETATNRSKVDVTPKKETSRDAIKLLIIALGQVKSFDDWENITRNNKSVDIEKASRRLTAAQKAKLDRAIAK